MKTESLKGKSLSLQKESLRVQQFCFTKQCYFIWLVSTCSCSPTAAQRCLPQLGARGCRNLAGTISWRHAGDEANSGSRSPVCKCDMNAGYTFARTQAQCSQSTFLHFHDIAVLWHSWSWNTQRIELWKKLCWELPMFQSAANTGMEEPC